MKETEVQAAIMRYLKLKGYDVWRHNQGGIPTGRGGFRAFNGRKGLPDIMGFMPLGKLGKPQMLFIEVKTPKGRVSPEQAAFIQTATDHGHLAFVARSVKDVIDRGV